MCVVYKLLLVNLERSDFAFGEFNTIPMIIEASESPEAMWYSSDSIDIIENSPF